MQSKPTPLLNHLPADVWTTVYEPDEDTFLLLDALEAEEEFLRMRDPHVCVERVHWLGKRSGSGCVITFLANFAPDWAASRAFFAVDINPDAVLATQSTARENGAHVHVVRSDLLSPLLFRLAHRIDVLIFNPPYVPCNDGDEDFQAVAPLQDPKESGSIRTAWDGGEGSGRDTTDRLIRLLPEVLSSQGVLYLVVEQRNRPEEIVTQLKAMGLGHRVIKSRCTRGERLMVLCISC